MCGLAGFLGCVVGVDGDEAVLRRMADKLMLRGPDDGGYWRDPGQKIGLGHRRLAIVDLSPAGHQPMESASGRYVIAFNGEIYNHLELRKQIEGARGKVQEAGCKVQEWRGHSDTETMLAGIEDW